jgi:uncharacterized protein (DUF58 family)
VKTGLRRFFEHRLLRLSEGETGPIRLTQGRIYVFPGVQGLGVAATLIVMLLASINYALALGYALTFLLAGACIASVFHGFAQLRGLTVRTGQAPGVFCGEPACFHLHIENPAPFARLGLRIQTEGGPFATLSVLPQSSSEAILSRPTHRRGRMGVGRVCIETRYPLGVVRVWSVLFPAQAVIVYPTPEKNAPGCTGRWPGNKGMGAQALNAAFDEDFAGFRPYRPGDSPRHVAWKAAARGGALLTKTYDGQAPANLFFDWNALPAGLDTEKRLSRLTAWVLRAEDEGCAYGVHLPGQHISPGLGHVHRQNVLTALALFDSPIDVTDHALS